MSNTPDTALAQHTFKPWWGYKTFPLIQDTSRWPFRDYAPNPAGFWEPEAQARFRSDAHWHTPVQWNDAAAARGTRSGSSARRHLTYFTITKNCASGARGCSV